MSDWVHCNKCSTRYNNHATFYLVECGHIFCHRCVEKIKIAKRCVICNKTGQVLLLNKDIEQNVLDFFLPLESFFKKALEIYKFQLQHRNKLFDNLLSKYNYAKKEYIGCHNTNKHLMKENQMLRSMLRSAGHSPQPFSTSTPFSHSSDNMTFNTTMVSSIPQSKGMASSNQNHTSRMYPGYPKRAIFSSGSSHGPSPAQKVPSGHRTPIQPPIHRKGAMGTMCSLEELRRGGKSQ